MQQLDGRKKRFLMALIEESLDKAGTLDWERTLCDLMDRLVELKDREAQLRQMEEVIDEVEDLVITAYYIGNRDKK